MHSRLDSSEFPELNKSVVTKLHSLSIFTVYDFILQEGVELMKKTGLTFKEIEELRELFSVKFGGESVNVPELLEKEQNSRIPTGIQNLDALLKGGLCCGVIYEICGSSSAGKSQLCHWLSMHATFNDYAKVHYIDGSRNFCVQRIQMMLEARHCDDTMFAHVISSIKVYNFHKIYELFSVLHSLANAPHKDPNESSKKKLIIIDSLSVLCATIPNMDLNKMLCNVAAMCRHILGHSKTVIIIVNTVRSKGGTFLSQEQETEQNIEPSIRPSLGNYWLFVHNIRLLITKESEKDQRKITIWNSNLLDDRKNCLVHIKDGGILQS